MPPPDAECPTALAPALWPEPPPEAAGMSGKARSGMTIDSAESNSSNDASDVDSPTASIGCKTADPLALGASVDGKEKNADRASGTSLSEIGESDATLDALEIGASDATAEKLDSDRSSHAMAPDIISACDAAEEKTLPGAIRSSSRTNSRSGNLP
jgi:hypothetical protein